MDFKPWLEWQDTSWTAGGNTVTIKQITDYLKNKPTANLNPQQLISQVPSPDLEAKRIKDANLNHPIIIASRGNQPLYVLDGNHRLRKAVDTQQSTVQAKMLDMDDPNLPPQWRELFAK